MRGTDETSGSLFSYFDLEERILARHPSRKFRQVMNEALVSVDAELEALNTDIGRPSIALDRLIRASLIQILLSVQSERQLVEQAQYSLLFRWFVGLGTDDPVWVPTVTVEGQTPIERSASTELFRDLTAEAFEHHIRRAWRPSTGSMVNYRN